MYTSSNRGEPAKSGKYAIRGAAWRSIAEASDGEL